MKWQLNINSLDGKRLITVNTDIEPKVSMWQMRQLIIRFTAPMTLTSDVVHVEFYNGMIQKVKSLLLDEAKFKDTK